MLIEAAYLDSNNNKLSKQHSEKDFEKHERRGGERAKRAKKKSLEREFLNIKREVGWVLSMSGKFGGLFETLVVLL